MRIDITRLPLVPALMICVALLSMVMVRHIVVPAAGVELLQGGTMPLGLWLERSLVESPILNWVVILTITLVNAVILMRTIMRNMVTISRPYLSLLLYVVISIGIYCSVHTFAAALSATLLLLAVRLMIRGFRQQPSIDLFFRASLLLGIAPLLWSPSLFYVAIIPVAVRLFRRSSREFVVSLVGFALPTLLGSYILWGVGEPFGYLYNELHTSLTTPSGYRFLSMDMGIIRLTIWSLLILLTSLSIATFSIHSIQMRTRQKRSYTLHLYLLVITIGLMFLPCSTPNIFPLLAIPLTVILQTFFVKYAGTISTLLFLLLVAIVVLLNTVF